MSRCGAFRRAGCAAATAVIVLTSSWGAAGEAASSDRAWVRAELRLNLRTGPGNKYRIVGALGTGDSVTVLKETENWT